MPSPIGASVYETQPLTVANPLTDAGHAAPLGFRTKVAANDADRLLCVILVSSGVAVGGEQFTRSTVYREAAGGVYYDYTVPASSGDQTYVYVANESGAVIPRGTPVKRNASGASPYSVTPMVVGDHPDLLVGVAQWAIADDYCGFVACENFAEVLISGAGTTAGLSCSIISGGAVDTAAITSPAKGYNLTTTGAGLAKVLLFG